MAKTPDAAQAPPLDAETQAMVEHLAQAVSMTRWEEGWSRRYLAEQSGLSERFIADVEAGKANPSLFSLAALAKALALHVPEMLSGKAQVHPRLAQLLSGLSSSDQEELIQELEAKKRGLGPARRLALIGLRGAGKTTVGRLLAKQLGCPFVELDRRIEDAAQLPLAQIFEVHGDAYYRRLEGEVLRQVLSEHHDVVIATGGGIVSSAETYALLRERSLTVWLKTKPEEYLARVLKQGDKRPMDRRPQALAELRALLATREPGYRQAAFTVETTSMAPEDVARKIVSWLERTQKAQPASVR